MKKNFWMGFLIITAILYFIVTIILALGNFDFGKNFLKESFLPMVGVIFFCLFMHLKNEHNLNIMYATRYVLQMLALILKGVASIALISIGFFCLILAMGTGGPSSFLVNFGIHILLFIVGILCGFIGTIIWIPKDKIDWKRIILRFGNRCNY